MLRCVRMKLQICVQATRDVEGQATAVHIKPLVLQDVKVLTHFVSKLSLEALLALGGCRHAPQLIEAGLSGSWC